MPIVEPGCRYGGCLSICFTIFRYKYSPLVFLQGMFLIYNLPRWYSCHWQDQNGNCAGDKQYVPGHLSSPRKDWRWHAGTWLQRPILYLLFSKARSFYQGKSIQPGCSLLKRVSQCLPLCARNETGSIASCSIETDEAVNTRLLRLPSVVQVSAILNSPR